MDGEPRARRFRIERASLVPLRGAPDVHHPAPGPDAHRRRTRRATPDDHGCGDALSHRRLRRHILPRTRVAGRLVDVNTAPAKVVGRFAVAKEDVAADLRLRRNLVGAPTSASTAIRHVSFSYSRRERRGCRARTTTSWAPHPRSDQVGSRFFDAVNPDCIGRANSDDDPA